MHNKIMLLDATIRQANALLQIRRVTCSVLTISSLIKVSLVRLRYLLLPICIGATCLRM